MELEREVDGALGAELDGELGSEIEREPLLDGSCEVDGWLVLGRLRLVALTLGWLPLDPDGFDGSEIETREGTGIGFEFPGSIGTGLTGSFGMLGMYLFLNCRAEMHSNVGKGNALSIAKIHYSDDRQSVELGTETRSLHAELTPRFGASERSCVAMFCSGDVC